MQVLLINGVVVSERAVSSGGVRLQRERTYAQYSMSPLERLTVTGTRGARAGCMHSKCERTTHVVLSMDKP